MLQLALKTLEKRDHISSLEHVNILVRHFLYTFHTIFHNIRLHRLPLHNTKTRIYIQKQNRRNRDLLRIIDRICYCKQQVVCRLFRTFVYFLAKFED